MASFFLVERMILLNDSMVLWNFLGEGELKLEVEVRTLLNFG